MDPGLQQEEIRGSLFHKISLNKKIKTRMGMKFLIAAAGLLILHVQAMSQSTERKFPLDNTEDLVPVNVGIQETVYLDKKGVKLTDTGQGSGTEIKYSKIKDLQFHNGIIELELSGMPMSAAGEAARGFVGIAFRIQPDDKGFECFYLRPTNGRADDQVRRNHSSQYISYPDYPWQRLRKETPEKYESYVDLEVGQWTKVKIEVQDDTAKLYVHGSSQPTLIVSDLKHGKDSMGSIGLWIGPGTEAHFRNLTVTIKD
jgi:hypothetical protein